MKKREKRSKTSNLNSSIHGDSGRKSTRAMGQLSSHLVNPVQVKLENELQQWCTEASVTSVPSLLVLDKHTSRVSERSEGTKNAIVVRRSFDTLEKKDNIKSVEMQSFTVGMPMLKVIYRLTTAYNTITKLKLADCGLTEEGICVIAAFLSRIKTVEDLNLDQNPVPDQNYACLLDKNTTLKHLSLRLCEIDLYGAEFLAQVLEFQEPANQHLLTLNLNSNHINCLAVVPLANALRTNRDLLLLSLADNWIEDIGVRALVEVLQQFELTEDEILIRRKRNLDRLLKQKHAEELSLPVSQTPTHSLQTAERTSQSMDKQSIATESKRRHSSGKAVKPKSKQRGSRQSHAKMSTKSKTEHNECPSTLANSNSLPTDDPYPFLQETFPQDGKRYCYGNFTLCYLNLAYNRISDEGMKQLLSTLKYQKDFKGPQHGTGLIWLNTKGNLSEEVHEDVGSIEEILEQKISYLSVNQNSVNTETSLV